MEKVAKKEIFLTGIIKQNPVLIMLLGMCPSLAVTSRLADAIGMALAFTLVLIISNILVSLVRKLVPNEIRIPVFIIIIATTVTIVELLVNAFAFSVAQSLGLFLPLIVVNCIVFGRAEAFAAKNNWHDSLIDALSMALGFAIAIISVAFIREFLATGGIEFRNPFDGSMIFDTKSWFISQNYYNFNKNPIQYLSNPQNPLITKVPDLVKFRDRVKIPLFQDATGAFLTLGFIIAIINYVRMRKGAK